MIIITTSILYISMPTIATQIVSSSCNNLYIRTLRIRKLWCCMCSCCLPYTSKLLIILIRILPVVCVFMSRFYNIRSFKITISKFSVIFNIIYSRTNFFWTVYRKTNLIFYRCSYTTCILHFYYCLSVPAMHHLSVVSEFLNPSDHP